MCCVECHGCIGTGMTSFVACLGGFVVGSLPPRVTVESSPLGIVGQASSQKVVDCFRGGATLFAYW